MTELLNISTKVRLGDNTPRLPVKPTLGLLMMVKNETKRIEVSLASAVDIVDCIIILDTGSTDGTQDLIRNYCLKHNKTLYMKEEPFVDFSTSRNVSLDFADDKADYLVLLDTNDEIRNGHNLRKFIDTYAGLATAFHICQEWWNGASMDKYYNTRLVKTKYNWRYEGVVHEYMTSPQSKEVQKLVEKHQVEKQRQALEIQKSKTTMRGRKNPTDKSQSIKPEFTDEEMSLKLATVNVAKISDNFTIFQDRTLDDDKSNKRFHRDKVLLYAEYIKNPKDPRTVFYLAQTCSCLNDHEQSYKLYKDRQTMGSFNEEVYHAFYRCGNLSISLGHDWEESIMWYTKAFEYSAKTFQNPRVEPMVRIADYYNSIGNLKAAYSYLRMIINIPYPDDLVLFVDRRDYDYTRYHLMGIVAYYAGQLEDGLRACLNAIIAASSVSPTSSAVSSFHIELDKKNLNHYLTGDPASSQDYIRAIELGDKERINQLLINRAAKKKISLSEFSQYVPIVEEIRAVDIKDKLKSKLKQKRNQRKGEL